MDLEEGLAARVQRDVQRVGGAVEAGQRGDGPLVQLWPGGPGEVRQDVFHRRHSHPVGRARWTLWVLS